MLMLLINEATELLAEGAASAKDIDEAMKLGAMHPIRPLSLAGLIGNDVCLSVLNVLHREAGDSKYVATPLLIETVKNGGLGRKSGYGLFQYS